MAKTIPLDFTTYEKITQIFYAYLEYNATWGSLHIALDDNNIDRGSIEFCLNYALENKDYLGAYLASVLLTLSDDELEFLKNDTESPLDQSFVEILCARDS
jgi:hypothetical protein